MRPFLSIPSKENPLFLHNYPRYLPTSYDESMSITQKINKLIRHVTEIGDLLDAVTVQWNDVMNWVIHDGISESVSHQMKDWLEDGTIEGITNGESYRLLLVENEAIKQDNVYLKGQVDNLLLRVKAIEDSN